MRTDASKPETENVLTSRRLGAQLGENSIFRERTVRPHPWIHVQWAVYGAELREFRLAARASRVDSARHGRTSPSRRRFSNYGIPAILRHSDQGCQMYLENAG